VSVNASALDWYIREAVFSHLVPGQAADLLDILKACSRETEIHTVGELLRRAWDANESITWRGALINRAIERIEVFPGIRKPFVNVDGVTMRFDKDRVKIIWRQKDGASSPAA
jgi:hypothetical protein